MNRRIPNGTYGGVGGRRLAAFFYPIIQRRCTLGLLRHYVPRNDGLFWDCHSASRFAMTGFLLAFHILPALLSYLTD